MPNNTNDKSIEQLFREGTAIDEALRQAVAEELEKRRRLGLPIVVATNATVRVIQPDEHDAPIDAG